MTTQPKRLTLVFPLLVALYGIFAPQQVVAKMMAKPARDHQEKNQNKETQAEKSQSPATELVITADDMTLIAADQTPEIRQRLATEVEFRKDFAHNLRDLLAVAEEGRAKGLAARPIVKRQLDLMRSVVIAETYFKIANPTPAGPAIPNVTEAEAEVFFNRPENQSKFLQFLQDAKDENPEIDKEPPADQIKLVRQELGKVLIGAQKGLDAALDQKRSVQLQILMEQSQVLARRYAQEFLAGQMKAGEREIDDYLETHPEYAPKHLKEKAEEILQRARAGEDFARLVTEYSTDQESREKGGDLGWFGFGKYSPVFENAVFALHTGQISDVIETKQGFHIIKLEGKRVVRIGGTTQRQVRARQILISLDDTDKSPRQLAQETIEREKQSVLIAQIVKRSHVTMPEDFHVDPPPPEALRPAPTKP